MLKQMTKDLRAGDEPRQNSPPTLESLAKSKEIRDREEHCQSLPSSLESLSQALLSMKQAQIDSHERTLLRFEAFEDKMDAGFRKIYELLEKVESKTLESANLFCAKESIERKLILQSKNVESIPKKLNFSEINLLQMKKGGFHDEELFFVSDFLQEEVQLQETNEIDANESRQEKEKEDPKQSYNMTSISEMEASLQEREARKKSIPIPQVQSSFLEYSASDIQLGEFGMELVVVDREYEIENVENKFSDDLDYGFGNGGWVVQQTEPLRVFEVLEVTENFEKSPRVSISLSAHHVFDRMLHRRKTLIQRRKMSLCPKSWMFKFKHKLRRRYWVHTTIKKHHSHYERKIILSRYLLVILGMGVGCIHVTTAQLGVWHRWRSKVYIFHVSQVTPAASQDKHTSPLLRRFELLFGVLLVATSQSVCCSPIVSA